MGFYSEGSLGFEPGVCRHVSCDFQFWNGSTNCCATGPPPGTCLYFHSFLSCSVCLIPDNTLEVCIPNCTASARYIVSMYNYVANISNYIVCHRQVRKVWQRRGGLGGCPYTFLGQPRWERQYGCLSTHLLCSTTCLTYVSAHYITNKWYGDTLLSSQYHTSTKYRYEKQARK